MIFVEQFDTIHAKKRTTIVGPRGTPENLLSKEKMRCENKKREIKSILNR